MGHSFGAFVVAWVLRYARHVVERTGGGGLGGGGEGGLGGWGGGRGGRGGRGREKGRVDVF